MRELAMARFKYLGIGDPNAAFDELRPTGNG